MRVESFPRLFVKRFAVHVTAVFRFADEITRLFAKLEPTFVLRDRPKRFSLWFAVNAVIRLSTILPMYHRVLWRFCKDDAGDSGDSRWKNARTANG